MNFVKAFVKDRKYAIKIDTHLSVIKSNDIGVPQGSVLSPTLFNLAMTPLYGNPRKYRGCIIQTVYVVIIMI